VSKVGKVRRIIDISGIVNDTDKVFLNLFLQLFFQ